MPVTLNSVLQVVIFLVVVLLITKPLGLYLTKVFAGERTWLSPVFVPIERLFYRFSGIDPEEEQKWTGYLFALLIGHYQDFPLFGHHKARYELAVPEAQRR